MALNPKTMEECAHACHECQDACLTAITRCLDLGDEHASREHQTAMTDCAAVCGLVHDFMHRRSPHAPHLCRECAEICRACADSCERIGAGNRHIQQCVDACKSCADACEKMATAEV
jgi:hypothetical protein